MGKSPGDTTSTGTMCCDSSRVYRPSGLVHAYDGDNKGVVGRESCYTIGRGWDGGECSVSLVSFKTLYPGACFRVEVFGEVLQEWGFDALRQR